jgi:CubicO group peptidase (beta-lactamase class C family)
MIDIGRWDKGPDNRWAFQHISEIIPVAIISRGQGKPAAITGTPRELSDLTFMDHKDDEMTIREMLDLTYTDGFIVLHEGATIFEKYYNGMVPETLHLLMSVSKSVTGSMVGQLVMDGRLDPNAMVTQYIPDLENSSGYAEATVRHVLDMTLSLVFNEDYDDPEAEVTSHEEAMAWRGRTPLAEKGVYAFAQTIRKDRREHGELFQYASINADVLGWLIERVTGQRYIDFMSESLWSKLGAACDAHISVDYFGSAVVNGGLCMTLRDMARFGQMMLDNGSYHGHQIVPSEWIEDIRFRGDNSAWRPTEFAEIWPKGFYRNQWWVTNDDQGSYLAQGVNGQYLWINPTTRVVIAKFSSHPKSVDLESSLDTLAGMNAIAKSLGE